MVIEIVLFFRFVSFRCVVLFGYLFNFPWWDLINWSYYSWECSYFFFAHVPMRKSMSENASNEFQIRFLNCCLNVWYAELIVDFERKPTEFRPFCWTEFKWCVITTNQRFQIASNFFFRLDQINSMSTSKNISKRFFFLRCFRF